MRTRAGRGPPRPLWLASATVVAVLVGLHWLEPDGVWGEAFYLAVIVGAGVSALFGAWRRPRETRVPWSWIAVGLCLSALGDLTYAVYVHVRGVTPDISVADVPWLASYVGLVIGLLMLLRARRRNDRSDVDGVIDMAVVGVVGLLVVWQTVVQATISDASLPLGVRAVWAAYPILDAALLALVVRTMLSRAPGATLIAGGVSCWLFSDFFYMLFPNSTSWSRWLDAGWMVGAALVAASVWQRGSRREKVQPRDTVGAGRIALAIAPLLVPGVIEVVASSRGVDPDPVPMLAASIVLALLAFARALRLLGTKNRVQAELRSAEQYFRALVQRSSDAALVLEPDGRVRYVSPAVMDQFGYQVDELLGRIGWDLVHPDDRAPAMDSFAPIMASPGAHASAELRIRDARGEWRWVEEVVTNLIGDPAVAGLVVNIRDISSRKVAEQDLTRMAHYDVLTGLPNRWLLADELRTTLATGTDPTALLIIDLDEFKFVNDSRGHAVGDQLLQAVAKRLLGALSSSDTVGRLGGDEFAVICRGVGDASAVQDRTAAVERALAEPVELSGGASFSITASVGIALAHPGESPERLLQQADTAMYEAKSQGTAQSATFDERLRQRAEERLTVQEDLRSALRSGELMVHYQPVIDLTTGAMDGVEALVRWRHPTRGLLMPGDFIPIAERSELIDRIGAFVLNQACTDAAWWARSGHPLSVAVNISATQLRHEAIASTIQEALYDSGLPARLLVLEITETALLRGAERAFQNVEAFRSLDVKVALDDFGTGYSSLSFLKRLPADIIKIDRSFISGITEDAVDRDIAAAIIDLALALRRTVVAEGVETPAQLAELRRLRCPLAQGYLWSPAVPAEQVVGLQAKFGAERAQLEPSSR